MIRAVLCTGLHTLMQDALHMKIQPGLVLLYQMSLQRGATALQRTLTLCSSADVL